MSGYYNPTCFCSFCTRRNRVIAGLCVAMVVVVLLLVVIGAVML